MTANPVELVVMLYDGCIKQLKMSGLAMQDKNDAKMNECLDKAYLIVMELVNSLDLHFPIGQELLRIYDFILNELVTLSVTRDSAKLEGMLKILEDLRDAWKIVAKEGPGSAMLADED